MGRWSAHRRSALRSSDAARLRKSRGNDQTIKRTYDVRSHLAFLRLAIPHPQAVDATNTKRSIDDRHFVIAHLAGAKPPAFFVLEKTLEFFLNNNLAISLGHSQMQKSYGPSRQVFSVKEIMSDALPQGQLPPTRQRGSLCGQ
jgi:hypothetical protein